MNFESVGLALEVKLGIVVHAFSPTTWKAEVVYTEKLILENQKKKKNMLSWGDGSATGAYAHNHQGEHKQKFLTIVHSINK